MSGMHNAGEALRVEADALLHATQMIVDSVKSFEITAGQFRNEKIKLSKRVDKLADLLTEMAKDLRGGV